MDFSVYTECELHSSEITFNVRNDVLFDI